MKIVHLYFVFLLLTLIQNSSLAQSKTPTSKGQGKRFVMVAFEPSEMKSMRQQSSEIPEIKLNQQKSAERKQKGSKKTIVYVDQTNKNEPPRPIFIEPIVEPVTEKQMFVGPPEPRASEREGFVRDMASDYH